MVAGPPPILSRRTAVRLGGGGLAAALAARGPRPAAAQDATPGMASGEANKTIVRRVFEEAVNGNNPAVIDELYAPDFVDHAASPDQAPGPEGIKQVIADFHALLPDVHVMVDAIVAEGDLVATREVWRGTDPATGRQVTGTTLHFWRIAGGKVAEEWSAGWEWLEQVGAGPATPVAST
jgi:predicted SnoaL-like aldol condensation-catalyzing enzyme